MWLKNLKANNNNYLLYIIIGVGFLMLNILTPEYLDDYLYKYTFINGIADKNHPIVTIKDHIYITNRPLFHIQW